MNTTAIIGNMTNYQPNYVYDSTHIIVGIVLYFVGCCCCACCCPSIIAGLRHRRVVAIVVETAVEDRQVHIIDVIEEVIPAHVGKI